MAKRKIALSARKKSTAAPATPQESTKKYTPVEKSPYSFLPTVNLPERGRVVVRQIHLPVGATQQQKRAYWEKRYDAEDAHLSALMEYIDLLSETVFKTNVAVFGFHPWWGPSHFCPEHEPLIALGSDLRSASQHIRDAWNAIRFKWNKQQAEWAKGDAVEEAAKEAKRNQKPALKVKGGAQ